jgi:hypothetical protein
MAGVEDMISEATRSVNNNTHGTPNEITEFYADRNGKDFLDALWCDMSITFWAFRSGNHEAVCFGTDFALTSAHANRFKEADQFQDGASEIRPGDIAFFPRDGLAIGHVGLVRTVEGDVIKTIEGNTSDAVRHRTHLISKGMIVGYGRPNYTKELTIVDEATRKFFDEKFKQTADHATELFRLSDHGSEDPGRSNHHKALREELQAFRTQVNQELSQLRSTLNRITTTLDRLTPDRDVIGGGEPPQG